MSKNKHYLVIAVTWLAITMFYCYQYILRILPNVIMPEIFAKFCIGSSEFGTFAGIYYIGYILVHIPIGILLSYFSNRIVLAVAVIFTASGLLPFIYAESWSYMILGRFITGIGSSAAAVGALQVFRNISPQHFSFLLGSMVCFGVITAVYSNMPLLKLFHELGITKVVFMLIALGCVIATLMILLLPKSTHNVTQEKIGKDVKSILCNYKLLLISIFAGLMVGPLEGFADAWGSAFMSSIHDINRDAAIAIISYILTGMCIGCIVLPYLAEKNDYHYMITILSGIVMILCYWYLLFMKGDVIILTMLCLIIGIASGYQVVIIPKAATLVSKHLSGIAAAIVNMIIMAFGFVFHKIIGITMDQSWDGSIENGVRVYSDNAYILSISSIPIAMIIAVIGFIAIASRKRHAS